MSPFIAEFIGTAILLLLGDGVVANVLLKNTKGNSSGWIVITTAWAFAVFAGVVIAGPHSGAHLNPAVTVGLAVGGLFPWCKVIPYIAAQLLGGFVGAVLVYVAYRDHFKITEDADTRFFCFSTAPQVRNNFNNLITEIIGTFVLIFAIFYLAGPTFQHNTLPDATIGLGSIGALPVAIIVWVIGLSLGGPTGYAINPARDLPPRLAHTLLPIKGSSHWDYAWIPVVGPMIGAVIAAGVFLIL